MKKKGWKVSVGLDELKKAYEPLRKKYMLPSFVALNAEFDVEKAQDRETQFILREFRREITNKVAAFLHFFELFLNPQTAPLFVLSALKNLSLHEKEIITRIYKDLVTLEIEAINLDVKYSEAEEARFIRETFRKWQELKPDMERVGEALKKMQHKSIKEKRSYFG